MAKEKEPGHGAHYKAFNEYKPGQVFTINSAGQKQDPEGNVIAEPSAGPKAKFAVAELEAQDKDALAKLAEANGIKSEGLAKAKLVEALSAVKE